MELLILLIWFACGIAAGTIASNKGRSGCGWFALGLLFGPFALLFAAVAGRDEASLAARDLDSGAARKCPFCAEPVRAEAVLCKHCRQPLTPAPRAEKPVSDIAFFATVFGLLILIALLFG